MENNKKTQEDKIHEALLSAKGSWINGQYFLREMYISQYHRAIHNLEKRGVKIEHSPFKDEYGFVSYRILEELTQPSLV